MAEKAEIDVTLNTKGALAALRELNREAEGVGQRIPGGAPGGGGGAGPGRGVGRGFGAALIGGGVVAGANALSGGGITQMAGNLANTLKVTALAATDPDHEFARSAAQAAAFNTLNTRAIDRASQAGHSLRPFRRQMKQRARLDFEARRGLITATQDKGLMTDATRKAINAGARLANDPGGMVKSVGNAIGGAIVDFLNRRLPPNLQIKHD